MPNSKTKCGERKCADKVNTITANVAVSEADTESIMKNTDAIAIVKRRMSASAVATKVDVVNTAAAEGPRAAAMRAVNARRFISSGAL